jgi:hypothetical protein
VRQQARLQGCGESGVDGCGAGCGAWAGVGMEVAYRMRGIRRLLPRWGQAQRCFHHVGTHRTPLAPPLPPPPPPGLVRRHTRSGGLVRSHHHHSVLQSRLAARMLYASRRSVLGYWARASEARPPDPDQNRPDQTRPDTSKPDTSRQGSARPLHAFPFLSLCCTPLGRVAVTEARGSTSLATTRAQCVDRGGQLHA